MELKIVFEPGQPVLVSGPIEDKLLCYGLLAEAHDAIQTFHTEKAKQLIQPARGVIR